MPHPFAEAACCALSFENPIAIATVRSHFQAALMAHRFDHLTLNPSPEGEELYSIAGAIVVFDVHFE